MDALANISGMTVPKKAFGSLRMVASLSDEQFGQMTEFLQSNGSEVVSARALASRLDEGIGAPVTSSLARDLVATLFNLSALHFTHEWSLSDIVDVTAAYPGLDLSEDTDQARLRDRLSALLAVPAIAAMAKATSIAYEHPNTFHTARIVTDVRPVFGEDATEDPTGAMITHALRLDYFGSRGMESFFVSMTNADLTVLSNTVQRALQKHETLRRTIERAELEELDATRD